MDFTFSLFFLYYIFNQPLRFSFSGSRIGCGNMSAQCSTFPYSSEEQPNSNDSRFASNSNNTLNSNINRVTDDRKTINGDHKKPPCHRVTLESNSSKTTNHTKSSFPRSSQRDLRFQSGLHPSSHSEPPLMHPGCSSQNSSGTRFIRCDKSDNYPVMDHRSNQKCHHSMNVSIQPSHLSNNQPLQQHYRPMTIPLLRFPSSISLPTTPSLSLDKLAQSPWVDRCSALRHVKSHPTNPLTARNPIVRSKAISSNTNFGISKLSSYAQASSMGYRTNSDIPISSDSSKILSLNNSPLSHRDISDHPSYLNEYSRVPENAEDHLDRRSRQFTVTHSKQQSHHSPFQQSSQLSQKLSFPKSLSHQQSTAQSLPPSSFTRVPSLVLPSRSCSVWRTAVESRQNVSPERSIDKHQTSGSSTRQIPSKEIQTGDKNGLKTESNQSLRQTGNALSNSTSSGSYNDSATMDKTRFSRIDQNTSTNGLDRYHRQVPISPRFQSRALW